MENTIRIQIKSLEYTGIKTQVINCKVDEYGRYTVPVWAITWKVL